MVSKISREQIQLLISQIKEPASVLYPDSEGYEKSLEKWSAVGCQQAVRPERLHRMLNFNWSAI